MENWTLLMKTPSSRTGLWRRPSFLKLWAGSTVSLFGSQITFLALPFTAVLLLHATAPQMSSLMIAETLPTLLIGVFAGVWVDRLPRRPLLLGADVGRALALGSIPLLALLGQLHMEYLFLAAFFTGLLTFLYDAAYGAYLPSLVDRKRLIEANSKLEMSNLLAGLAGPGLAGWLIQLISAPVAIVVDAFSFLASALAVWTIRVPEVRAPGVAQSTSYWRDLGQGLRVLMTDSILRPIAACAATENFFGGITDVVRVLFFVQVLHLGAVYFGLMFSVASVSALVGALANPWLARIVGIGPTMLLSAFTLAAGWVLIPLAGGPPLVEASMIVVGALLFGVSNTLLNVNEVSLRQHVTPNHLLGRVGAGMQFIGTGSLPLGALIGGVLGEYIGLRATFLAGSCGLFLAALWIYFSPVRSLRIPTSEEPSEST
ncbi:MAG: MFS transporter [Chloroflexi bacterium]|nr:MAG: MFS transporter [Chloroflexota bacterium]